MWLGCSDRCCKLRESSTINHASGLLIIACLYAVILAVGAYASRKPSAGDAGARLIVADRGMPLWLGVFTMTATWVGGGYINGTAEAVYDARRGLVWCQAPFCYALSLILGGIFFARPMRRAGYTTMLDPFLDRYGKRVTAVLYCPALLGEVFWGAAILAALGTTFASLLDLDVQTSIVLSAAIAVGYTMMGGLWSVAYTDVVQLLCIAVGLGVAIPFVVDRAGGLSWITTDYVWRLTQHRPFPGHSAWNWADVGLMLILGGIPWQVYFQRVLACRNEHSAVRLSLVAGILCLLMAVPPMMIGAAGATVDWAAEGIEAPANPALVLPHVVRTLTPPIVATLVLAAVAAAVMSSVDSSILSASSMFTWNIYRPWRRSAVSGRELRLSMRLSVVVVGIIATWLALRAQSVYVLWSLCADLVYVVIFPQLVLVLFTRQSNGWGALCGIFVGVVLRLGGGEPELGLTAFLPYPMGADFPFRTVSMLANLATTWIVSVAISYRPRESD